MHGKDRPLSPAGHFAMTEKYALMYYDDDQTKKNGTIWQVVILKRKTIKTKIGY
jgi:hypothetical protein